MVGDVGFIWMALTLLSPMQTLERETISWGKPQWSPPRRLPSTPFGTGPVWRTATRTAVGLSCISWYGDRNRSFRTPIDTRTISTNLASKAEEFMTVSGNYSGFDFSLSMKSSFWDLDCMMIRERDAVCFQTVSCRRNSPFPYPKSSPADDPQNSNHQELASPSKPFLVCISAHDNLAVSACCNEQNLESVQIRKNWSAFQKVNLRCVWI